MRACTRAVICLAALAVVGIGPAGLAGCAAPSDSSQPSKASAKPADLCARYTAAATSVVPGANLKASDSTPAGGYSCLWLGRSTGLTLQKEARDLGQDVQELEECFRGLELRSSQSVEQVRSARIAILDDGQGVATLTDSACTYWQVTLKGDRSALRSLALKDV